MRAGSPIRRSTLRGLAIFAALAFGAAAPAAEFGAGLGGGAGAGAEDPASPRERYRMQCLGWLDRGYPSGLAEKGCRSEFDLPSAYLVECVRGLRLGFESAGAREACALYLARASDRVSEGYLKR